MSTEEMDQVCAIWRTEDTQVLFKDSKDPRIFIKIAQKLPYADLDQTMTALINTSTNLYLRLITEMTLGLSLGMHYLVLPLDEVIAVLPERTLILTGLGWDDEAMKPHRLTGDLGSALVQASLNSTAPGAVIAVKPMPDDLSGLDEGGTE